MAYQKIKLVITGIATLFLIVISWYFIDRFSFAKTQPYFQINKTTQDNVLTVGIIGDSWVAGNKLDSMLHEKLLKKGQSNRIISSGKSSARSKLIYQNLFKNNDIEHSSKFIIESQPEYCIVIAGVNDKASRAGKNYYSFHVIQIIKTLLHYKIKPVVVSLPEFDVVKTIDDMNFLFKTRTYISAKINNDAETDNIKTYRAFLNSELQRTNLSDSVILIDFNKVCPDYLKCKGLYKDSAHLSKLGNEKLTEVIASELIEKIKF
ncbi:SGNH/GDSL hydrolase family protein [uncultured Algibacter sp.]|uniref:SGNH/GDSL hydrolase family protein n=1 Tax=uncultured Algibacter sp. TaxID=298659 RepID=UPI0026158F4C|nr:SGNH/GDSL hydrolase family protein [uncultured Algibacter sp.]